MSWQPLPPGGPIRRRRGSYQRERDSELLGRTVVDQLVAKGAVVLDDDLTVSGSTDLSGPIDMNGNNIINAGMVQADRVDYLDQGSNPSISDGPNDYPDGFTINTLSSASGWPIATGWVETWRYDDARAYQVVRSKTGGAAYERYWASASTWSNWRLVSARVHGGATGSSTALTAINTFQPVYTLTITDYPTSSFDARVNAQGSCSAVYSGTSFLARVDLQISLDGGSTWAGSGNPRQSGNSGWNAALSAGYARSGSVTGSIQARLRGYASQLCTYDELSIVMTISGT